MKYYELEYYIKIIGNQKDLQKILEIIEARKREDIFGIPDSLLTVQQERDMLILRGRSYFLGWVIAQIDRTFGPNHSLTIYRIFEAKEEEQ